MFQKKNSGRVLELHLTHNTGVDCSLSSSRLVSLDTASLLAKCRIINIIGPGFLKSPGVAGAQDSLTVRYGRG